MSPSPTNSRHSCHPSPAPVPSTTGSRARRPRVTRAAAAAPPPPFPRTIFKRFIREASGCKVGKDVDILVYLNYVMFMNHLIKEAMIESKKSGEKVMTPQSIMKVVPDCMARFKG